ncbi:uncharacterized protein LOC119250297 [Talpa occidentalis]|uniref:uncharacterized protein LOC119250297 n=1 Tax=Talpa occidentalis TaxID=50954 RepID=UPI0018908836|nr:uncharacterized protein LOC119250297 [Talpa occidentalis]
MRKLLKGLVSPATIIKIKSEHFSTPRRKCVQPFSIPAIYISSPSTDRLEERHLSMVDQTFRRYFARVCSTQGTWGDARGRERPLCVRRRRKASQSSPEPEASVNVACATVKARERKALEPGTEGFPEEEERGAEAWAEKLWKFWTKRAGTLRLLRQQIKSPTSYNVVGFAQQALDGRPGGWFGVRAVTRRRRPELRTTAGPGPARAGPARNELLPRAPEVRAREPRPQEQR